MLIGSTTHAVMAKDGYVAPDPLAQLQHAVTTLVEDHQAQVVEISLDELFLYPEMREPGPYAALAAAQQQLAVPFTAHLPFVWVDLASGNELVRQASVQTIVRAVELTAPLNILSYVVHATGILGELAGPTVRDPDDNRRVQLARRGIDQSLKELRERLPDAPLAVENLPGIPFEWQETFVLRNQLSVCCDVGHLLLQHRDPLKFIEQWSPRLLELHLHGVKESAFNANLRYRVDHLALGGPGELVDAAVLLSSLRASGFTGPIILENDSEADLTLSLRTLRAEPYN
jgi:sugar phosphate isomerase/epimerase